MISWPKLPVGVPRVHVGQSRSHILAGQHRHVLDAQGLKHVLLEIVVERQPTDSLQGQACPVDAHLEMISILCSEIGSCKGHLHHIPSLLQAGTPEAS